MIISSTPPHLRLYPTLLLPLSLQVVPYEGMQWYFCVVLWRKATVGPAVGCESLRYVGGGSGQHGRSLVLATCLVGGRRLQLGCTHLESPVYPGSDSVRVPQLRMACGLLAAPDGFGPPPDALLCGDFNFVAEAEDTLITDGGFVDAWAAAEVRVGCGGGDPGWTFDCAANANVNGPYQNRPDRITLRSAHWRVASIEIVGKQALGGGVGVPISDHYGLLARLEM